MPGKKRADKMLRRYVRAKVLGSKIRAKSPKEARWQQMLRRRTKTKKDWKKTKG